jgi:acyl-CoA synthetase (AMP-forming)/AMP-acid ligase II/pimeloyl-ACP methyl ester carboxylesterase
VVAILSQKLFPFESHFITIDGQRMHYVDEGSGPVVVLLHGNPTWCFYYRNVIQALKENCRVIAVDYIGCGLSDHPTDKHYRAVDRMNQVEELLNRLKIDRFSLVMHDWGGPIGTGVAVRNLSRVEKLVYLNTTLTEIDSLPKIIKTAATPLIGKFITQYTSRFIKLATSVGVTRTLPREVKDGYFYPYQTKAARTAIWDFVADIPFETNHPTYSELVELSAKLPSFANIPVQIIWGLRDPCFHKDMLGKVAQHFPHASVLEIPDASHLVLEDKPELATETIKQFLLAPQVKNKTPEQNRGPLYEELLRSAAASPNQDVLITGKFSGETCSYTHTKYADFVQKVHTYERGLTKLGLMRGDKVLFLVPVGVEFLALAYAVIGRGAIPVFVDPGVGFENLKRCIADAAPDVCISSLKAYLLRSLLGKSIKKAKFNLIVNNYLPARGATLTFLKKFSAAPLDPVPSTGASFIAFTSGGTGTPKGVIFTDTMLKSQLQIFRDHLMLTRGGRDMPLLPIFTIFHAALGVTSVIPPLKPAKPLALNPHHVVTMVNDLSVTTSFGSPTLWTKIAEYCRRKNINLPSIKQIFIAGAPVTNKVFEAVNSVLPNGSVTSPYGATEALPVTVLKAVDLNRNLNAHAKTGEQGLLVGAPLPGCSVKIIAPIDGSIEDIKDIRTLGPFEIGEIIVQGNHVSPTYLNRLDANRLGKIKDGASFWHRMGDMGYLDEQGNIFFCGRKIHVVRTPEHTFFSIPVERVFNEHHKVRRSALVSLFDGKEAAIAIEPLPQFFPTTKEDEQKFAEELEALAGKVNITKTISKFYFHPSFPVDNRHNAKIFRDKLSIWATEKESREKQ